MRLTAWEAVHHLIRVLETRGETGAAELAATLGGMAEIARELCYRLYTLCERKKRAGEALSYLLTPELLSAVGRLVVESGHKVAKKKPGEPLRGRCDSFVVETDVHYPTDVSLLWTRCVACCGRRG